MCDEEPRTLLVRPGGHGSGGVEVKLECDVGVDAFSGGRAKFARVTASHLMVQGNVLREAISQTMYAEQTKAGGGIDVAVHRRPDT